MSRGDRPSTQRKNGSYRTAGSGRGHLNERKMPMERYVHTTCPYCGKEAKVKAEDNYGEKKVVLCDSEEGGCDKYFVADITVFFNVHPLKIEGEDADVS